MNCTKERIESVIAECQAVDEPDEEFRPIFECYYGWVLGFLRSRTSLQPEDCEDLTQEVFLIVSRKIKLFGHRSSFKTWLWAIMNHHLSDYFRNQRRTNQARHALPESFNEEHEQLARDIVDLSSESNPHERALDHEFEQIFREAVNSLPPKMRNCMLLRLQGYTYEEIARLTQIDRGTVSKHLYDARGKIKDYLKRRFEGEL